MLIKCLLIEIALKITSFFVMAHKPRINFWPIVCKTAEKSLILRKIIKLTTAAPCGFLIS